MEHGRVVIKAKDTCSSEVVGQVCVRRTYGDDEEESDVEHPAIENGHLPCDTRAELVNVACN